jgi:acetyl esterase/lipase
MRKIAILAVLILGAACSDTSITDVAAQNPRPQFILTAPTYDITYCGAQQLDFYPANTTFKGVRPAVIGIHGGAWLGGDKLNSDVLVKDLSKLRNNGFSVFMINYRVGPGSFPYFIEDAKCAVRFVRTYAATFKVDPDKVGVIGHSAGGHIAALLATLDDSLYAPTVLSGVSSRPDAVVTYAGPMDLTADSTELRDGTLGYIATVFGDRAVEGSPVNHVSADDVPLLAFHGTLDESISYVQSERLVNRLVAAGVQAQFVKVVNGGHYLTVPTKCKNISSGCYGAVASPSRTQISNMAVNFFKSTLQ